MRLETFFTQISIFLFLIESLTILAIFNVFYFWPVLILLLLSIILLFYVTFRNKLFFKKRHSILLLTTIFLLTTYTFLFHQFTFDGARDHGAYFNASINLANTGSIVQHNLH